MNRILWWVNLCPCATCVLIDVAAEPEIFKHNYTVGHHGSIHYKDMCNRPKIKTSKLSCVLKAGAVRRQHGRPCCVIADGCLVVMRVTCLLLLISLKTDECL